jgi:hypothetical protein
MTPRLKKLLAVILGVLVVYFGLYFVSVRVTHIEVKSMDQAVPQYRPWDSEFVHTLFGLAQTLDSGIFRPVHWRDKAHD